MDKVKSSVPNFNPDSHEHIDLVAEENVRRTILNIRNKSKIIRDPERANKVRIVGGIYDIATGKVNFL